MKRPKVLLVSSLYAPDGIGGAERIVQAIAESTAAHAIESVVVTLTQDRTASTDHVNGIRVHRIPIPNGYWPFGAETQRAASRAIWHARDAHNRKAATAVADILATEAPDVVHTHNISGFSVSIWGQVADRRIPLVHTMHDQYLLCPRSTMYRDGRNCATRCRSCQIYTLPKRRMEGLPDLVTGPSQFILDRHVEHGWFEHTQRRIIRNARVPDTGDSAGITRDPTAPFRFGFLGRIDETKGLEPLLRAFAQLSAPAAELVIAGTGEHDYERHVRSIAADCSNVRWLGFVETSTLLDQVDVLVVPSTWDDTAPLVVMEAFGHGRPVLGSDRGGIPELVGLGAGWIFDPDDHSEYVRQLWACIDRRPQLADLGLKCRAAASAFTHEHMVDGYLAAYRDSGAERF